MLAFAKNLILVFKMGCVLNLVIVLQAYPKIFHRTLLGNHHSQVIYHLFYIDFKVSKSSSLVIFHRFVLSILSFVRLRP